MDKYGNGMQNRWWENFYIFRNISWYSVSVPATSCAQIDYKALARASVHLGIDIRLEDNQII